MGLFSAGRKARARRLIQSAPPRRIRIHSVTECGEGGGKPFLRVAFEFLDVPGPWSMQFYEAAGGQDDVRQMLEPGAKACFRESNDGAQTRVLTLLDDRPLWPR